MTNLDTIKYEIFRHRLFNILEEGRLCVRCGYVFCDSSDNYKYYALYWERDLSEAKLTSPFSGQSLWVRYQEYLCPGRGALLGDDNFCPETDKAEEKVLWDTRMKT